jgi:hypothetical protein
MGRSRGRPAPAEWRCRLDSSLSSLSREAVAGPVPSAQAAGRWLRSPALGDNQQDWGSRAREGRRGGGAEAETESGGARGDGSRGGGAPALRRVWSCGCVAGSASP